MGNLSLAGKKVQHTAFGPGTILKQDGDYITVQFAAGEKMFVFPDVFSQFLRIADRTLQQKLEASVQEKHTAAAQAIAAQKADLQERRPLPELPAEVPVRGYRRRNAAFKCHYDACEKQELWDEMAAQLPALKSIRRNSMCVLTTKPVKAAESQRYVFAVFLVDMDSDKAAHEPMVCISSKYKLHLAESEANRLLFWNYHASKNSSGEPSWSTGGHRYVTDAEAVQILRDIVTIKTGARDEHLALDFFNYFCQAAQVDMSKVGNPAGALIR